MRDACLMDEDVAARNRFSSFSPVFPVRDLRRALAHYASLGFEVEPYADEDGYGFAGRDEVSLHLSLDEGHGPGAGHQHVGTACMSRTPTRCTTSGRGPASAGGPPASPTRRTSCARAPTSTRTAT